MIAVVTFFAIFAGTYLWYPKMFGRQLNQTLGKLHFWLTVPGVIVGFVGMHFLGMGGEQRHLYDPSAYQFLQHLQWLNVMITFALGSAAVAQVIFLANFFWSLRHGARATPNPWEATTLEWTTPSPAPHGNWPGELPVVYRGPYEYRVDGSAFIPQNKPDVAAPSRAPVPA